MMARWTLTTAEGTVIACDDQASLVEALIAIRRASESADARGSAPIARRQHEPPDQQDGVSNGGWDVRTVKSFFARTSNKAANMLRVAASLGDGATAARLALELKKPPGALGPMFAKLARDAAELGEFPPPVITIGKPGAKTLSFGAGFLPAFQEMMRRTSSNEGRNSS